MADQRGIDHGNTKVRSAISNGSRLTLFGDGRSAGARRFRDLITEFGGEIGGFTTLSATAQQIVRRLAQVSVELELMEATRASGAGIDPVGFCSMVNSQRRLLRDLEGLKSRFAPTPMTLAETLAAERKGASNAPMEAA
ncbi:MAG: hypothetical protein P4L57_08960 [Rhizomicrobium sp.]|nr:hypothetical protein [Rhizomicrobium sp.]